jgi:hypothetical protein
MRYVNICNAVQWHAQSVCSARRQVNPPAVAPVGDRHPQPAPSVGDGHDCPAPQPGMRCAHAPVTVHLAAIGRPTVIPIVVHTGGHFSGLHRRRQQRGGQQPPHLRLHSPHHSPLPVRGHTAIIARLRLCSVCTDTTGACRRQRPMLPGMPSSSPIQSHHRHPPHLSFLFKGVLQKQRLA